MHRQWEGEGSTDAHRMAWRDPSTFPASPGPFLLPQGEKERKPTQPKRPIVPEMSRPFSRHPRPKRPRTDADAPPDGQLSAAMPSREVLAAYIRDAGQTDVTEIAKHFGLNPAQLPGVVVEDRAANKNFI